MSPRRSLLRNASARWLVCCCLLVALPVCGLSTLLSASLGAVHFHRSAVVAVAEPGPMAGWSDFRRAHHVADSAIRVHDHSQLGRHHHDAHDTGLVTVGAGENDEGIDAGASATGVIVLAAFDAASLRLPAPSAIGVDWVGASACSFRSCDPGRLDKPPITA